MFDVKHWSHLAVAGSARLSWVMENWIQATSWLLDYYVNWGANQRCLQQKEIQLIVAKLDITADVNLRAISDKDGIFLMF